MQFDITDLKLFAAVAEMRSITHGAARAHLALASASARIRQLEAAIGATLLIRSRRGVTLTAAGETLRDHALIVLNDIETMRGDLAAHARGLRATVHLLTNTAGLSEHLPGPLVAFLRAHPTINIDVEERESADIVAAVAAGSADVGIAIDHDLPPAVKSYPFCCDRLMLAVQSGDPLIAQRKVRFADVVARDFIGLADSSALQAHLVSRAAHLGVRLRNRVRMKGFDAICQVVAQGIGIAIMPEAAIKRSAQVLPIVPVPLSDPWTMRSLVVCVRHQAKLSPAVRDLVAHLREAPTQFAR